MTSTAEGPGTDNHGVEISGLDHSVVRVPARRALVDSPSWAGCALLSLALVALITTIVATGPAEWALAGALVVAVSGTAGMRRLAATR